VARTCVRQAPSGGVVVSKSVLDTQQGHARRASRNKECMAHGKRQCMVALCPSTTYLITAVERSGATG
jgi:hypothetical protein